MHIHAPSGYALTELIRQTGSTLLYRGRALADGRAVVIELLADELPSLLDIASLTREFELTKRLNLQGIEQPLALESHRNGLALVFASFPSSSLRELIDRRTSTIDEALELALALIEVIGKIHACHVVHKQIHPGNVFVDRASGQVMLANFFCATELEREKSRIEYGQVDLAYVSPEQTGRINRTLDHRTDFYSFGVTLYELLTGRLPFTSSDLVELIHQHIAAPPPDPAEFVPELAGPISAILMRLLAKTAEDRYQSAHGIKVDLERCLAMRRERTDSVDFLPATEDRPERLELPQRLYGRERELARLLAAFDRIAGGRVEMLLVRGYSGIGKSSLVREVQVPMIRRSGYFGTGKFDQYKRSIPYHAFVEAFGELTRQILTESDTRIARWRDDLQLALGVNGQVILDVLPELELLLGPQPPVPELEPAHTQVRFNLSFEALVDVFATLEHPLILFLDDLQWADASSLSLIQRLLARSEGHSLLLLGAYRDNEVDAAHPLALTLAELESSKAALETIELGPLEPEHVARFVADTFRCNVEHSRDLAALLQSKVAGNPFFLIQMLEHLVERRHLTFSHERGAWEWNIEAITALGIADNIVDLMVARLGRLPEASQLALQRAACIGSRFSLELLAVVSETESQTTAQRLWQPLVDGLLVAFGDDYKVPLALTPAMQSEALERGSPGPLPVHYKFAHDRVHQAAYALIPEADKPRVHLEVGQLLLEHVREGSFTERIFDVVGNLNRGAALVQDDEQRAELASLNLEAGRRARASAAYAVAREYLEQGLVLLGANGWSQRYSPTLDLHVAAIEARYLTNDTAGAEALCEAALAHIRDVLDEAKIQRLRILFRISRNELHEGIRVALALLVRLDVDVEALHDDSVQLDQEFQAELAARGMTYADLPSLPAMTSPTHLVAMDILAVMNAPAFLAAPKLWPKVAFMMGRLCLRYGNSFASGFVYIYLANFACGVLDQIERGYALGSVAQQLPEQFFAKLLRVQASIPYNLAIRHWKEPLRDTVQPYYEGIQDALAIGDVAFASFHSTDYTSIPILVGSPSLEVMVERQAKYMAMSRALGQGWGLEYMAVWRQLTANLLGRTADPTRLVGEDLDEDRQLPVYEAQPSPTITFTIYLAKCMLAYWFGDNRSAVAAAEAGCLHELGAQGFATIPFFHFYHGLALLGLAREDAANAAALRARAQEVSSKFRRWAEFGPVNYLHKYELLLAEDEAVFGEPLRALELYDRAIAGAGEQGFVHEQALAHERAAELYSRLHRQHAASAHFEQALHGYTRWGAQAKVDWLTARMQGTSVARAKPVSSGPLASSLDLEVVVRASQALTGEIVLAKLLDAMMRAILANAGAQRAVLLVEQDGRWVIEVEGILRAGAVEVEIAPTVEDVGVRVAATIVKYAARTRTTVLLDDAAREGQYTRDPYVVERRPASVLCIPLLVRGRISGVFYLENNLTTRAFSSERVELLTHLLRQAAIAIENARLYERLDEHRRQLEARVIERTASLDAKNRELANALEELETTQARIVAQEKLASLGVLTAGIAHEIRNPLNIIINFVEHLQELHHELTELLEPKLGQFDASTRGALGSSFDALATTTDAIHSHGLRADKIIHDMRVLSLSDSGEATTIDIASLVRDSLRLGLHSERSRTPDFRVETTCNVDPDIGSIHGVAADLTRALLNVLSNALYAANAKGQSNSEFTPRVDVEVHPRGPDIEIAIRDNGMGIPADIRDKIFTPFFTTKPPAHGTGLGLSICNDIIVRVHGGRITVNSVPGSSTEFVIRLPRQPTLPSRKPRE